MKFKFKLSNGMRTFFQWDAGQKIIFENPQCTYIHFENKEISEKAYVKDIYLNEDGESVVDIPDIFLQYPPGFLIYGYVVEEDGHERYTKEFGSISVIERAKPDDYVFTPEDQKTLEDFEKELNKKVTSPEVGKVGDVLVVKSVDENGRPTEWETTRVSGGGGATDPLWSDIRNKPFEKIGEGFEISEDGTLSLPTYDGDITVTPQIGNSQKLNTANKFVKQDIKVKAIPEYEVSNDSGGNTFIIGKEVI